ncbi:hypothetical protein FSP39_016604 [Pinctada imbricata]|uniref:C1q domain-containing protein n=1 Tax=Pinctada imbricata TaxID=66713 RepID=A0AA88XLB8_PINIB|nr:hypothetical protein FSP39_016604 [Pinctada imbricata]
MSIEFDNDHGSNTKDIRDKMLVFVDAPELFVPNREAKGVLYYGPGVHNLNGQKLLDSSVIEVYIAPGAFIKGGFRTTSNHAVKIHGRGVLSTEGYPWHDSRFKWATINMDSGSGYVIEGITISDPTNFYIRALGSHNTVRNVKTVAAWTFNSDGVATGSNGLVENSFFMANDDAIKLYADNIVVRNCVVWQCQNGAVFQTGWWSSRKMHHVRVSDVDVIHTDWCTFKGNHCQISARLLATSYPTQAASNSYAFYAYMSNDMPAPSPHHTFIYDHVVTNEGGHYNHHSGIFTVPQSGVYVFSATTISDVNAVILYEIVKNSSQFSIGLTNSASIRNFHTGTLIGVIYAEKDDIIYVRSQAPGGAGQSHGSARSQDWARTSFCGWRLS